MENESLKEIPVDNRCVICEQWHGMERRSGCWCKTQAEAIEKFMTGKPEDWIDIDGVGIIDWLYDRAEADFLEAVDRAEELMEYMLYIIISPENRDQRCWRYKLELTKDVFEYAMGLNAIHDEGNVPLQKGVAKCWDKLYQGAVEKVLKRAKPRLYLNDSPFYTELIPKEPPWTIEDFLNKSEYELLEILFEEIHKSE